MVLLKQLTRSISIFFAGLITFCCVASTTLDGRAPLVPAPLQQHVVLISLDGFRWDYIEKFAAKNLAAIADKGVRAKRMQPVYPTKTFPNHLSMVTGLLPVNHGIIDNEFCDSARQLQCYQMGMGKTDSSWVSGIPLWNLVKMNGLKSATYFWPESEARINGMVPDYYYYYSQHADYSQRVEQIMQWLRLPNGLRPTFVAGYFSLVDTIGHRYGPDSEQTKQAVLELDALIGLLYADLQTLPFAVNLVIVSDHGMAQIDPKKAISYPSLPISNRWLVKNSESRLLLYAKSDAKVDKAKQIELLKAAAKGRFKVLSDEQLAALHYQNSSRIPDIILETQPPRVFKGNEKLTDLGIHGYVDADTMDAIFIAAGPAFKTGLVLPVVENLDVYPTLAQVMGLTLFNQPDGDGATLAPALLPAKRK
ncbi:ectonucleotide pyrophosphatase/phosphodiesterase [Pseudoalteromonas fenneropenaei]|uniref:Ectonucleotide pyrophosphatase/phosphodiesterase n=1 Tax=Pseudoalteromonas fenneropenaei TaxID=1737459 RepID=A0ABV7CG53_9GAMM